MNRQGSEIHTEEELLKTPLFENLRKLINVVDELRDVGLQEYINLPRIAVLGQQSSGKSSLLESIVGMDFLPRGEGVVTRRPLELRLVHVHSSAGNDKPWGVFENNKNEKIYDFDKIRDKIVDLTEKDAGKNKGIIHTPILLTVYSPYCPDLTLIDLPGITRIPLSGSDQPANIEEVTKNLALKYVKDERTIILCVVPANADISTSDGLQMARQCDPEGKRTIGVITKIDIMDKGTNAKRMIMGQEIPLRLGYVGVKNRSQHDINTNMRVKQALDEENEFFAKHPVYSTMPPGYLGTKALTQKLSTVMFNHIRAFLPKIIKEINQKIKDCEEKLKELGPPLPRESKEVVHLLWNMITDFTENFKNSIRGKYDGKRNAKLNQEISGGAVIKQMFNDLYREFLGDFRATNDYSDKDIDRAIILHQGDSIPGFPSIDSFLYLIQPQLEKLKEPAIDCLQSVFIYLENLASKLIDKLFQRFPQITDEINEIASKVLQDERDKAKEVVENIIDAELGYLFTNDYEYLLQRTNILPKVDQGKQQNQPFDPNRAFIMELRQRIDAYFSIVVRNIRDSVPKSIGYFLVKSSQERMQYSLYNEVMKNDEILHMLAEPPHISNERETINKILGVLRKAQKVLKKDPDLAMYDKSSDREESDEKHQARAKRDYQNDQNLIPAKQQNRAVDGVKGGEVDKSLFGVSTTGKR